MSVAIVIGAGPGLGAAIARRFAREGFRVAVVARNASTVEPLAGDLTGRAYTADTTDPEQVARLFADVRRDLGAPSVLAYNAAGFRMAGVLDLSPADFERGWKVGCLGAFLCAREALPAMLDSGAGTILFTGATSAMRGGAKFSGFAVGKFGLRALGQSIAREYAASGIHVAHVIIDGRIEAVPLDDARRLAPDAIAETYWQLHVQPRSAWTHELDLRPASEKF